MQTTQQKLSHEESEVGQLESEVLRLKAQTGDVETLGVLKHELSEQVAHIKKLEATNRDQLAELKRFRKQHKSLEVVEEEKRILKGKLRSMDELHRELGEARLQRQILEDERKSWTAYLQNEASTNGTVEFDSPESLAKAIAQERLEKAALIEKMGSFEPELLEKVEIIKSLEGDKDKLQREADKLRLGGSGDGKARARLERQKALAEKEVEYLRAQLVGNKSSISVYACTNLYMQKTFDAEETTFQPDSFDEQKTKRVQELEELVDRYRKELQALNEELARRESDTPVPESTGTKRAREEEPDERLGQLARKNRKLQNGKPRVISRQEDKVLTAHAELSKAQQTASLLQKELDVSKTQLTSRTRILELRNNPTAEATAIKTATLTALQTENAALLSQLQGHLTTKVVPISTLENARGEMAELRQAVADKEKRMTRLKEIWSAKSLEFREAVASILGFKLDFMPNGRVRVTSMFHAADHADHADDGANSIVFDGEQGTMKVSGGPNSAFKREIKDLIRFWVEERKEIPCFLAAMTLEFYEKTTRAARM